jgi:phosphoglycerate dehydrogenase-like enzyme
MKKTIGIAGLEEKNLKMLKKKFKCFKFLKLNDLNFFNDLKVDAIIIYREGRVANSLRQFFIKEKYSIFKNLKWFHLSRAGIDEYEISLKKIKFILTCGKKIQGPNVSEHCIAMLLYLTRNLNLKNSNKEIIEIYNKKALIVGLGSIGISIAEKLHAFGVKVSAITYSSKPIYTFVNKIYNSNVLSKIVGEYDIVINSSALTKITKNIFNQTVFSKMKKKSYFINVSRGMIVNTSDLLKNVDKFSGVGLDVLDFEPVPKNHPLKKYKNVLLTNHTAGISDNLDRRFDLIFQNLKLFKKNQRLINIVNVEEGY